MAYVKSALNRRAVQARLEQIEHKKRVQRLGRDGVTAVSIYFAVQAECELRAEVAHHAHAERRS